MLNKATLSAAILAALVGLNGCATAPNGGLGDATTTAAAPINPLLAAWDTPHGVPPFATIAVADFAPALDAAMAEHRAEIAQIRGQRDVASFDNTILALERAGDSLERVAAVFMNRTSTMSTPELREVQARYAPLLAKHRSDLMLDAALFARVQAVHAQRTSLNAEQQRVTDKYFNDMRRAGVELDPAQRKRVAEINQREAALSTQFSQNLLADTAAWTLTLGANDLDGLPPGLVGAAKQAAIDRGQPDAWIITLQRPSVEPFLAFSARRDLREKAYAAWIARGDNGNTHDNNAVIAELVKLRAERAQMLGFESHAEYVLADNMAQTPEQARALMDQVWQPARARALEERAEMLPLFAKDHPGAEFSGADWRYYAEKVRQQRFDLKTEEIAPYFELNQMIAASFAVSERLFGVRFDERTDLPVYHPDVRVWEVTDANGAHIGLFYGDYFAREGKQGGAWMSSFRRQHGLDGGATPVVVNVLNYSKAPAGEPTLLSFTDAETLFHELGHGLHGLLSDVRYPLLSGTAVSRDFVEFPAQILEHWLSQPEVLSEFAKHAKTGEAMPEPLMQRMLAARTFQQGFQTVEFLKSAFVDMDFHSLDATTAATIDPDRFERDAIKRLGAVDEIVMRHRSPHFSHVFAGGYSAGYYSYLWSEVLDADGFAAFKDAGNLYDPALAQKLKTHVYSAGNRVPPMQAYVAFRGREPRVEALLAHRGFADEAVAREPQQGGAVGNEASEAR
jgi:peptidyl-dipeptidase Dcp